MCIDGHFLNIRKITRVSQIENQKASLQEKFYHFAEELTLFELLAAISYSFIN